MGTYIIRRLIAMVLMLVALSMFVFFLFSVLPTNPARLTCGKACTPAVIRANEHRLGLDKPVPEQYWLWVKGIFVGRTYGDNEATFECPAPCLGYSFVQNEPVNTLIRSKLPVTIQLAVGGFILWMFVGIFGGIIAALRRGTWSDRGIMAASLVGYSFPSFFIALLLVFFVTVKFGFPANGYVPFGRRPLAVVPGHGAALDRDRPAVRRVLHAADPQPDAGDAGRGLHPYCAGQGAQGARASSASTRSVPASHRSSPLPASTSPASWAARSSSSRSSTWTASGSCR